MKCAMPTATTILRVVPRGTRIVADPSVLVTCMPGGYGGWWRRATYPLSVRWLARWLAPHLDQGHGVAGLAAAPDHPYGSARNSGGSRG